MNYNLWPFHWLILCTFCLDQAQASHAEYHRKINNGASTKDTHRQSSTPIKSIPPLRRLAAIEQMKNRIKRVLNVNMSDNAADQLIFSSFNLRNPNPSYVFVLPDDEANQTISFQRSDFAEASFPNVTTLQMLRKFMLESNLMETNDKIEAPLWKNNDAFWAKYEQTKPNADDENDEEIDKTVQENTRTERNFFRFMDQLNAEADEDGSVDPMNRFIEEQSTTNYENSLRHIHPHDSIGNYKLGGTKWDFTTKKYPATTNRVSWKDFGLHGWAGPIENSHQSPNENSHLLPVTVSHTSKPNIFPPKFIEILANYDPLALLTSSTTSLPPWSDKNKRRPTVPSFDLFDSQEHNDPSKFHQFTFVSHNNKPNKRPPTSLFTPEVGYLPPINQHEKPPKNDTWEVKFVLSPGLRLLLQKERERLWKLTQAMKWKPEKPHKWPVTNSRWMHRDKDVFIGRANNPFGHSSKWKFRNGTDVEDSGREKRSAYDLYSMVKCSTGCDPLLYKGYGCYCGFLGNGRPLDGIDRCCKAHDNCYEVSSCPKYLEYFVPYVWKCYRGKPICAQDHGEWGGPGSCAEMLCECDRRLAKCLSKFRCPRKRAVCKAYPFRLLQNLIMDFGA